MKRITILSTAILLTSAAGAGWWRLRSLEALREQNAGLRAEAVRLGVAVSPTAGGIPAPVSPEQERKNRDAAARAVAERLIRLDQGPGPEDPAQMAVLHSILRDTAGFDASQWRVFTDTLRTAGEVDGATWTEFMAFLLMNLASSDPPAALTLLLEVRRDATESYGSTLDEMVPTRALAAWAKIDPRAAAAWIGEKGAGSHYRDKLPPEAAQALLSGAALTDPRAAFALIKELPAGDPRKAVFAITRAASTPSLRAAALTGLREYLPTVEDAAERKTAADTALRTLAQGLAGEPFAEVGSWLASAGLDAGEQETIATAVSFNLRGDETGPWLEWMAAVLPPESAAGNTRRLLTAWTESDHEAAAAWLTALPAGPARESAVSVFAETVAPYEPEAAAQWALTLPPGPARQATLQEIHDSWPRKDPASTAAAEAFARENGLAPL